MKTLHYQYRIEFQSRGAGHNHGVLWLDLPQLDSDYPGISQIFRNIKTNEPFNQAQMKIMIRFIDNFISCSLDDNSVKDIVKDKDFMVMILS